MTQEEKEKLIATNPRIRRFVESGDSEKASRLISMSYLLFSIAQNYTEEAMDIIEKHHLYHFNLKHLGNSLIRSFDRYNTQLKSMIVDDGAKEQFMTDYDTFEAVCRKYMEERE